MLRQRLNISNILIFVFLTSIFLLALTKTYDMDAWIHLTMGRLIWTLKGFPEKEPFLYTILDKPFEYSSWLFGVVYYLSYKLFDTYGVIILKASTITLAFYILLKDSLVRGQGVEDSRGQESGANSQLIIAILVLSITAILTRARFIERPDTFLMVFLPFSIYSLNAYIYQDKKYIYSLPLVHFLWANTHSSINLMFIPFGAVLTGLIIQGFKGSRIQGLKGSKGKIKTILIVLVLSFCAALINPNFIGQFTFAFQFMKTGAFKEGILELQPSTWVNNREFYILGIVAAISFILRIGTAILKNQFYLQDVVNPILAIPFFYLGESSIRFILLFAIVSGPVIVKNITGFIEGLNAHEKFSISRFSHYALRAASLAIAVWIFVYSYSAITRTWLFDKSKSYQELGFGFKYGLVPEKALTFMDKNGIYGRVLNQFEWGQYITWRDFPKRQASIDGRVSVNVDLFEIHVAGVRYLQPLLLPKLYEKYGFESILIKVPNWTEDRNWFVLSDEWAIVYWDELSMLFLKRGGDYDHVIKQREYKFQEVKTRLGDFGH